MNRRVAINLAVFGLVFATMVAWAVDNVVTIEALEDPYRVTAEFPQAAGVLERAEVAYLGVSHGAVTDVERVDGGVRVTMSIDRGKRIPAGSSAHIFRKSAVGEPYIDLFPPEGYERDADGPYLVPGDNIPRSRTTTPLEFSELLRSASRLVSGIDPERLDTLVSELALALDGRGDDLRRLTLAGDRLTSTFAARTEVLDRLATNNTRLTHVMAEHRGSLGQSVSDLRALADTLRRARGDTTVLLERGSRLLDEAAGLVAAQEGNLDCLLGDLEAFVRVASTPERVDDLVRALEIGPVGYGAPYLSRDVEDDGVWVRVGTVFNPENPSRQYVPPVPVPEVPTVQPCRSPLRPSGVDFEPLAATRPGPIGLGVPPGAAALVGLAALTATAVLRLSVRRTG